MTTRAIDEFLNVRPKWQQTLIGFVLVVLLGGVDHVTGFEISFSVFYLIPIIFTSWYVGEKLGVAVCFASAVTWFTVDYTSGHMYSQTWIPFWNAFTRFIFFILVTALIAKLRENLNIKEKLLRMDALTGVLSLRAFLEDAAIVLNAAARYHYPVSLGFIDLDGFKSLNDSMGHAEGDEALKATGAELNIMTRKSDLGARIGGDEFVVLLPHTDKSGAEIFFERLHGRLLRAMKKKGWALGFTIGVAVYLDGGTDLKKALARADALMLAAKKTCKNSVVYEVFENTNADAHQIVPGDLPKTAPS